MQLLSQTTNTIESETTRENIVRLMFVDFLVCMFISMTKKETILNMKQLKKGNNLMDSKIYKCFESG